MSRTVLAAKIRYTASGPLTLIPTCCVSDFGLGYKILQNQSNTENDPAFGQGSPHGTEGFMAPVRLSNIPNFCFA